MLHHEILAIAADQQALTAPPGTLLIEEGEQSPGLFILRSGTLEVRRSGQLVAVVEEPGSMVGEMALLLGSPSTADVVARDDASLYEIADPEDFFATHPQVSLFLARILAQRLHAVTGYLAELRERYGDAEDHLGLASAMVERLLASRGTRIDVEAEPSEVDLLELEHEDS